VHGTLNEVAQKLMHGLHLLNLSRVAMQEKEILISGVMVVISPSTTYWPLLKSRWRKLTSLAVSSFWFLVCAVSFTAAERGPIISAIKCDLPCRWTKMSSKSSTRHLKCLILSRVPRRSDDRLFQQLPTGVEHWRTNLFRWFFSPSYSLTQLQFACRF